MISLSPMMFLVLAELLLLFGAAAAVLGMMIINRKRKERRAVGRLIVRIKEDEKRRRDETRALMEEKFGFKGESLDKIVKQVSREEKRLYQTLINLFLNRNLSQLEVLHVECEGVTEPYRNLDISLAAAEASTGDDDAIASDLSVELDMLREENERLTTELGVTMDTMGKMLSEYASMYGGGAEGQIDKAKMMESFRQAEQPAVNAAAAVSEQTPAGEEHEESEIAVEQAPQATTVASTEDSGDIYISDEDQTMVIEPEELADDAADETMVLEVVEDEFEELEELDDETELIDLAADEPDETEKPS
ncbi:MAG: hypothetical protein KDI68_16005 [Gammaproteobacteria bacterium]|nr:hypothetical protein [Gammaproteobacteria bacterium]